MEAMDICLATVKEISFLISNHPLYSALGSIVLLALLMHFYCRLTLGECDYDIDMTGKTVLITGASSGIGKATAQDMARRNARVILACRNVDKAQKVAEAIRASTGNEKVFVKRLDLCSFESVRKCAQDVLETEDKLHVLFNNAGISSPGSSRGDTEDRCCEIIQANHLSHFLLTRLLLDLLKQSAPSRIINVAAESYALAKYKSFSVEDLKNREKLVNLNEYSYSKLANILFTRELARRLSGTGVTVNALHPGLVKTSIFDRRSGISLILTNLLLFVVGKTAEEGAQTSIYLAVHPDLENTTGKYFSDCKPAKLKDFATDRTLQKELFKASEEVVGLSFPKQLTS